MFSDNPQGISINSIQQEYPEFDDYWYELKYQGGKISRLNLSSQSFSSLFPYQLTYTGLGTTVQVRSVGSSNYPLYVAMLFKLMTDVQYNGLNIPSLSNYDNAMTHMQNIGISNIIQRHEIFMTYHIKAIHFICNLENSSGIVTWNWGSVLDGRLQYVIDLFPDYGYTLLRNAQWMGTTGSGSMGKFMVFRNDNIGPMNVFSTYFTNSSFFQFPILSPMRWKKGSIPDSFTTWDLVNGTPDPMTAKYAIPNVDLDWYKNRGYLASCLYVHEFGHAIDFYNCFLQPDQGSQADFTSVKSQSQEWKQVGGWYVPPGGDDWADVRPAQFWHFDENTMTGPAVPGYVGDGKIEPPISFYGGTNPQEDWAECFACYILNPVYFQDMFPRKFKIMDDYVKTLRNFELNRLPK